MAFSHLTATSRHTSTTQHPSPTVPKCTALGTPTPQRIAPSCYIQNFSSQHTHLPADCLLPATKLFNTRLPHAENRTENGRQRQTQVHPPFQMQHLLVTPPPFGTFMGAFPDARTPHRVQELNGRTHSYMSWTRQNKPKINVNERTASSALALEGQESKGCLSTIGICLLCNPSRGLAPPASHP